MIAIVFCGDLKYCPYINRYLDVIEKNKKEYCVYFWNRGGYEIEEKDQYKFYNSFSALNKNKVHKLFDFIKFRKWLLATLKNDKPDKLIILSTLTGVILASYLFKQKNKYIFDIRDYSYEKIKIFYIIEKQIINHSYRTVISSKGFKSFLPEHDYIIAHNFNRRDIKSKYYFTKKDAPIKFVWNGVMRYFNFQSMYLDKLKNDKRFLIIYHGDGPELDRYKEYARNNGIHNIVFTGEYDNANKEYLLSDAQILNNCYGYKYNAGDKIKHAVSNRFYDGIIYHIPQLVETGGFKAKWVMKSGIGVCLPLDDNFADALYEFYMNIDTERFNKACDDELQSVLEEDNLYIKQIKRFIE